MNYILFGLSVALVAGLGTAARAELSSATSEPAQLTWARRLVAEVAPDRNAYNSHPTFVVWSEDGKGEARNRSVCSSFVTHDLERAFGFGADEVVRRFGLANPQAKDYYDTIAARRGFEIVERVDDIRPGDILAVRYPAGSRPTGHVMMVDSVPELHTSSAPLERHTRQYEIAVIDSSHSYHGLKDTRYERGGKHGQGVGRGTLRLYVDKSGHIAGYAWSTRRVSLYFPQSEHEMIVGRFEQTYSGPAAAAAGADTSDESPDSQT